MTSVLVSGGTLVTMDAHRRVIANGAVRIKDDRIEQVGKQEDLRKGGAADVEIDARGMVVIPGLVDTHVHLAQALIRGCADDTELIGWLQKFVWPLQGNYDAEDGRASAQLCMLEMIKSGTTTFLESLLHSKYGFDGIADSLQKSGMRGVLSKSVMGLPSYGGKQSIMHPGMVEDAETTLRETETHFKRWNGKANDRIKVWYGARSLGGCTPELFSQIATGARRLGTGITMHLSEVKEDVKYTQENFGMMPVEFMNKVGFVGSNVVFVHGVWLTEKEWAILAEKGATLAHCPSSNMKIASGIAPIPEMIGAGVNVSLGCDGGPSNNCYDMIREMKTASLLQKARLLDPLVMDAETVLEMATIRGAKALGLQDEIGSIEDGKKADLTIIAMNKPHLTPVYNPVSHLIYAAEGTDVDTVIVDGRIVMENRVVKTLDEQRVLREANERGARLLEKTGIVINPKWPLT